MTTHQFINRHFFNLYYCHVFGSTSVLHSAYKRRLWLKGISIGMKRRQGFFGNTQEKIIMLKDNVNCIDWLQRAILWNTMQSKSMVWGGGPCEWDKWSCPRKAWMRPWKPYLNLVSTKLFLCKNALQSQQCMCQQWDNVLPQNISSRGLQEAHVWYLLTRTNTIWGTWQSQHFDARCWGKNLPPSAGNIFRKGSSLHLQVQNLKLDIS